MHTLFAIGGLILAAAITPGPNNFLVLKLAGRRDLTSVLAPIGGIVAGGLAMLALAQLGIAVFASRHAWVRDGIVDCGALYLVALGLLLVYRSVRPVSMVAARVPDAPVGAVALLVFQFLNPKAWVLVLTVSAAANRAGSRQASMIALLLLFGAVSTACLVAWAALGRLASRLLQRDRLRVPFECAMGLSLVVCAGTLLSAQGVS